MSVTIKFPHGLTERVQWKETKKKELTVIQHQVPCLSHQRWRPKAHIILERTKQERRIGARLGVL